jgi:hemoglobin-like flavoprotein
MSDTGLKRLLRRLLASPTDLTAHQQRLIHETFERLVPVQETAAALFCARLFTLDPKLRCLFRGEIEIESQKLMAMVGTVADNSHCPRRLVRALRELGKQLDDRGIVESDCDTVAAALIWALNQTLGADFKTEVREAWTACCGILADEIRFTSSAKKGPVLPPC